MRRKRKGPGENKKKGGKNNVILDDFAAVDVSKEKLMSYLFHNMEFSVMPLDNCPFTTNEIERDILLNDGQVVKNPLLTTQFIVTNSVDFRIASFQRYSKKKYTFIKPKYIKHCIMAKMILPLSPIYLAVLPSNNTTFYLDNFDKFGDSFTSPIDMRELDEILSSMGDNYHLNDNLISAISLKPKRNYKVSICFNISDLDIVKLKYHGNQIVNSFEQQPNSVIVSKEHEIE